MSKESQVELLTQAREEILGLRRSNELMAAKIEVMDLFACVLQADMPTRSHSMSKDVVYAIDTELEALNRVDTEPPTKSLVDDDDDDDEEDEPYISKKRVGRHTI